MSMSLSRILQFDGAAAAAPAATAAGNVRREKTEMPTGEQTKPNALQHQQAPSSSSSPSPSACILSSSFVSHPPHHSLAAILTILPTLGKVYFLSFAALELSGRT